MLVLRWSVPSWVRTDLRRSALGRYPGAVRVACGAPLLEIRFPFDVLDGIGSDIPSLGDHGQLPS